MNKGEKRISDAWMNHGLFKNRICRELVLAKRDGRTIHTVEGLQYLDFLSCSYLGLETHPLLKQAAIAAIEKWGVQYASSRLRARIGEFDELEALLSEIYSSASIAIFTNLTTLHAGVLAVLATGQVPDFRPHNTRGFRFLVDRYAHASIQANRPGMEKYGAVEIVDVSDLGLMDDQIAKLCNTGYTPFICCDAIGSMGGLNPVAELVSMVEQHHGYLYVDDAHGVATIGARGSGYAMQEMGYLLHPQVILSGSLAKGFGTFGAFLAISSDAAVDYIKKMSSSYTFSGPPPLPMVGASIASAKISLSGELAGLQDKLQANLQLFDRTLIRYPVLNVGNMSPIRGLIIGEEERAVTLGQTLYDFGIACNVALYPVVRRGAAILRFAISAAHASNEIEYVSAVLSNGQTTLTEKEVNYE